MKKMKKSEIQLFNRENVLAIFDEKIEIRERCKGVHCVDLGESFPTRIYLQKSASIQQRTSLSKFGGKFNSSFIRLLRYNQLVTDGTPVAALIHSTC